MGYPAVPLKDLLEIQKIIMSETEIDKKDREPITS